MNAHDHLEQLARELIGDGRSPNLYVVRDAGCITTIATDRRTAYLAWRQLAARRPLSDCTLEDREHGLLASSEHGADGRLHVVDRYATLTGDRGLEGWEAAQLRDYAESERAPERPAARRSTCRHCGLEIEGVQPYIRGIWRDRGNNTLCPQRYGAQRHAPEPVQR